MFCHLATAGWAYPGVIVDGWQMQGIAETKKRMMRTSEAASYCGSTSSTFEKLRLYGGGPRYVKLGRRVVYDPADLDAWLDANRRTSTSDVRASR